jgi:hypothetical protein
VILHDLVIIAVLIYILKIPRFLKIMHLTKKYLRKGKPIVIESAKNKSCTEVIVSDLEKL